MSFPWTQNLFRSHNSLRAHSRILQSSIIVVQFAFASTVFNMHAYTTVCEPVCSLLFMLTYVSVSICVYSTTSLFIHYVGLLLKLSVQFWIKAKQVSLWEQTDGRPHAETRILFYHISFPLSVWSLPCISTDFFTGRLFTLTDLYEPRSVFF